jgi:hypothetical protein
VGGPTPSGTAGGLDSYFFLVFAFALGFAAAAFFFGAAFFFVAANSLTPFQIIQSCPLLAGQTALVKDLSWLTSNVFGPTLRKRGSRFKDVATEVTGVFPRIGIPPSLRR